MMQLLPLILFLVVLINGLYVRKLIIDLNKNRQGARLSLARKAAMALSSYIIYFLSAFGVPDFSLSTILYRKMNWVTDEELPGTLNTQCVLPVAAMALAFITVIEVDTMTLLTCIVAQSLGAYIGPRFVVKLSVSSIRWMMGLGLVIAAVFILAEKLNWIPLGGTSTMLGGIRLSIAAICLFFFGALNNIGIGSYAPTMVTVYALGLNPMVAFPIMMGASTLSVPIASMQFIRFGRYNRVITFISSTVGLMGAICGVYMINSVDLSTVRWIVAVVLLYSGLSMLKQQLRQWKAQSTYTENPILERRSLVLK